MQIVCFFFFFLILFSYFVSSVFNWLSLLKLQGWRNSKSVKSNKSVDDKNPQPWQKFLSSKQMNSKPRSVPQLGRCLSAEMPILFAW